MAVHSWGNDSQQIELAHPLKARATRRNASAQSAATNSPHFDQTFKGSIASRQPANRQCSCRQHSSLNIQFKVHKLLSLTLSERFRQRKSRPGPARAEKKLPRFNGTVGHVIVWTDTHVALINSAFGRQIFHPDPRPKRKRNERRREAEKSCRKPFSIGRPPPR